MSIVFSSFSHVFTLIRDMAMSVVWHLWMILTLRPQMGRISDGIKPLATFFVVYMAAGMLRWTAMSDQPELGIFMSLLMYAGIAYIILALLGRMRLLSMCLAISAAVDLACYALYVAGIIEIRHSMPVEVALLFWAAIKWKMEARSK